jgi:chorismate dehydratase
MYKFAVLPYTNTAPLAEYIPAVQPGAELIYRHPAFTLNEILRGQVDAGIVPVVDYFNTVGLERVEGIGICSDGDAESVLLQCKCPLKDVKSISLDPASKTSNLLIKVLLKEHFRRVCDIRFDIDQPNADARVLIGDNALCARNEFETYDLSGLWKAMFGLPFVFAVWVYKADHPDKDTLCRITHDAKVEGMKNIALLSETHASKAGISKERCFHYLTNCIHYNIGENELAAMKLFRKLSKPHLNSPKFSIKEIMASDPRNLLNDNIAKQLAQIESRSFQS